MNKWMTYRNSELLVDTSLHSSYQFPPYSFYMKVPLSLQSLANIYPLSNSQPKCHFLTGFPGPPQDTHWAVSVFPSAIPLYTQHHGNNITAFQWLGMMTSSLPLDLNTWQIVGKLSKYFQWLNLHLKMLSPSSLPYPLPSWQERARQNTIKGKRNGQSWHVLVATGTQTPLSFPILLLVMMTLFLPSSKCGKGHVRDQRETCMCTSLPFPRRW